MVEHYLEYSTFFPIPKINQMMALNVCENAKIEFEVNSKHDVGCEYEWHDNEPHDEGIWGGNGGVWLRGDNAEGAAYIIQELMKTFDHTLSFYFSYCYYCSKPRLDEQGGGAVGFFKTKEGVEVKWFHPVTECLAWIVGKSIEKNTLPQNWMDLK